MKTLIENKEDLDRQLTNAVKQFLKENDLKANEITVTVRYCGFGSDVELLGVYTELKISRI